MKKIIFTCLLLISVGMVSHAQFQMSRVTFGGGVGLQFGDYTLVNIAPQVGYDVTKYLNMGAGFTYTRYSDKYDNYKLTNDYLGFNIYGRVYPLPFLVFQLQPEVNRMWQTLKYRPTGEKVTEEKFVPVCLIGGGVRLGAITAMIQYDLAQNSNSPYGDKLFYSVGYTFSF